MESTRLIYDPHITTRSTSNKNDSARNFRSPDPLLVRWSSVTPFTRSSLPVGRCVGSVGPLCVCPGLQDSFFTKPRWNFRGPPSVLYCVFTCVYVLLSWAHHRLWTVRYVSSRRNRGLDQPMFTLNDRLISNFVSITLPYWTPGVVKYTSLKWMSLPIRSSRDTL